MGPVPAACSGLEGDLGQRVLWRAVTSMRRRFMSSMVQPMPVRATAARSMPFVFAPVDAMTLSAFAAAACAAVSLAFRPVCPVCAPDTVAEPLPVLLSVLEPFLSAAA